MAFRTRYPLISTLLGDKITDLLEAHHNDLAATRDDQQVEHFSSCEHSSWCSLNTIGEYNQLDMIESLLISIRTVTDSDILRRAFSKKAKNNDQFNELLAEIVTAGTCAIRANSIMLEWKTGRGNCDADVRANIDGESVNFEVTLRTDTWLSDDATDMKYKANEKGELVLPTPVVKSRKTTTPDEKDDLRNCGTIVPESVEEVIARRKKTKSNQVFINAPDQDLPGDANVAKAYCADGDSPKIESTEVQNRIQDKAKKFNCDGYHFIVLATTNIVSPSEQAVSDAVFGQSPQIKHHGLFYCGQYDHICGVIYLPVLEHMYILRRIIENDREIIGSDEMVARLFPNPNATVSISPKLLVEIARVFLAKIKRSAWL